MIQEDCGKKLSSFTRGKSHSPTRASNQEGHLNKKHLDIFKEINNKDEQTFQIKQGVTMATASTLK